MEYPSQIIGILTIAQGIYVTRIFGPENYGVVGLITSLPNLLNAIFEAKSSDATVKYLGQFDEEGDARRALAMLKFAYLLDFALSLIAFSFVFLLAKQAEIYIVQRSNVAILIIISGLGLLPRSLIGNSVSVFRVLNKFGVLASLQFVTSIIRIVGNVGVVFAGFGVRGLIFAQVLIYFLNALIFGIISHHFAKQKWGQSWLFSSTRYLAGLLEKDNKIYFLHRY